MTPSDVNKITASVRFHAIKAVVIFAHFCYELKLFDKIEVLEQRMFYKWMGDSSSAHHKLCTTFEYANRVECTQGHSVTVFSL